VGLTLLGGVLACAGSSDNLPAGLSSPDRGVVCNRARGTCYDRYGPSIGLTEAFLGGQAAERLLADLRARSKAAEGQSMFSPAPGTECDRGSGSCRVDGRAHLSLTRALYGPWPERPPGLSAEAAAIMRADWRWLATRRNDGTEMAPPEPDHYSLRLDPDSTLHIRAGCKQTGGRYRLDGSMIAIEIARSTVAACESESLVQVFLRELPLATSYFMWQGRLYLVLKDENGIMELER
jgi:heat shock protein HslJ